MKFVISPITVNDNPNIKRVIQNVFIEHGINRPGTAFFDPCLDNMFAHHNGVGKKYFIVKDEEKLIGGAGVYPTDGLPNDTCELVKMYLLAEYRGMGIGRLMIEKCISSAKEMGYSKMYLETTNELSNAIKMYEKFNFKPLTERMGDTGHHSCGIFMMKEL